MESNLTTPTYQALLDTVKRGQIRAIGGDVYDSDMEYFCSASDLHSLIRQARTNGIAIERVDAGGRPTWRLNNQ